jgi:hypothetical protein
MDRDEIFASTRKKIEMNLLALIPLFSFSIECQALAQRWRTIAWSSLGNNKLLTQMWTCSKKVIATEINILSEYLGGSKSIMLAWQQKMVKSFLYIFYYIFVKCISKHSFQCTTAKTRDPKMFVAAN